MDYLLLSAISTLGQRKRRVMAVLGGFVLCAILFYGAGIVLECEYPYWPLLWKARHGVTWDGRKILDVLQRKFPPDRFRLHWHTCSYCWPFAENWKTMPYIRVDIFSRSNHNVEYPYSLHFFFRRADHVIFPADKRTAGIFPGLLPPDWHFLPYTLGYIDGTTILAVEKATPPATSTPSPTPATSSAASPGRPRPSPAIR